MNADAQEIFKPSTDVDGHVFVLSQLPPPVHGSTVMTNRLVEALEHLSLDVHVVQRRFSWSASEVGAFSVRKIGSAAALVLRVILQVTRRRRTKWIYFLTNRPFSFVCDCLIIAAITLFRGQLILYLHTLGWDALANRSRLARFLLRVIFRRAAAVVLLDERQADDLRSFVGAAPIVVIPNAGATNPSTAANHDGRGIVFLSNLIPGKNVERFVDLALEAPDVGDFLVCGDGAPGYVAEVQARARRSDGTSAVTFLGHVDDESRTAVFRDAQLMVFPSTYALEAQPLSIIEAMGAGVPVLARKVGLVSGLITHGYDGYLVDDEASFLTELRRVASDPSSARIVARQAQQTYLERHSPSAFQAAWRSVLADRGFI